MTLLQLQRATVLISILALGACASSGDVGSFTEATKRAAPALLGTPVWQNDEPNDVRSNQRIQSLVSAPLTESGAVEIAMLANHGVRAIYYALQAANGEYGQRAQWPNPFVSAVQLEVEGETTTNYDFDLSYPILDLLFLPRARKQALALLEGESLNASRQLIDIATQTRIAYFDFVVSQQLVELSQQAANATHIAAQAADAQFNAGNIAKVERDREALMAAQLKLALNQSKAACAASREKLNALMGLSASLGELWHTDVRLTASSFEPATQLLEVKSVLQNNLALAEIDAKIRASAARLGINNIQSVIGDVELEGVRERDDGEWENGIGLALQLPLFNVGGGMRHAARARLQAMVETRHRLADQVRSNVRSLNIQLDATKQSLLDYEHHLLPLATQVLHGTQRDYNAMHVGLYRLLEAKQEQVNVARGYLQTLKLLQQLSARKDQILAGGNTFNVGSLSTGDVLGSESMQPQESH